MIVRFRTLITQFQLLSSNIKIKLIWKQRHRNRQMAEQSKIFNDRIKMTTHILHIRHIANEWMPLASFSTPMRRCENNLSPPELHILDFHFDCVDAYYEWEIRCLTLFFSFLCVFPVIIETKPESRTFEMTKAKRSKFHICWNNTKLEWNLLLVFFLVENHMVLFDWHIWAADASQTVPSLNEQTQARWRRR